MVMSCYIEIHSTIKDIDPQRVQYPQKWLFFYWANSSLFTNTQTSITSFMSPFKMKVDLSPPIQKVKYAQILTPQLSCLKHGWC